MAWRVSECCCGCSLRTGSISIGIGNAVYSAFCLVATIVMAVKFPYQDPTADSDDIVKMEKAVFIVVNCFNALWMLLNIIVNYLLVRGVKKGKPTLIKSWIYYTVIFLAVHCVLNVIFGAMDLIYGDMHEGAISLFSVVWNLVLQGYFIIVVRSYLDEVEDSGDEGSGHKFKGTLVIQDSEQVPEK